MFDWSIKEIELPLKFTWNISRNSSDIKRNFIVEVKNGNITGVGEIAFNVRYGESREQIIQKFEEFKREAANAEFNGIESIVYFLDRFEFPQSLKFGIESAFVHYVAKLAGKTVPQLLLLNSVSSIKTSFSIPIMDISEIKKFYQENNLDRFSTIKIKINRENGVEFTKEVLKITAKPLRIDANESFQNPDEVMRFTEKIGNLSQVEFLEQPLPAHMHDESLELKKVSPLILIADESVTKEEITSYYVDRFHGVNIKLMKSGGYLKGVKQLRQAKNLGLKTMLGCMIETSLGISSALQIASGVDYFDLDGFLIIKNDPFDALIEENGKIFFNFIQ